MIVISTYWGVTLILLIIVIICALIVRNGDLELGALPFVLVIYLCVIGWLIYSLASLVINWNNIPQIIKFT